MFPLTVEFARDVRLEMTSDRLKGAKLLKPIEIAYGHTILVVPAQTIYHAVLKLPWRMRLALWITCRHDQQIMFVAEAACRGRLKILYEKANACRPVLIPQDAAEIVCDLLQTDGVSRRARRSIQPRLQKELERHWHGG